MVPWSFSVRKPAMLRHPVHRGSESDWSMTLSLPHTIHYKGFLLRRRGASWQIDSARENDRTDQTSYASAEAAKQSIDALGRGLHPKTACSRPWGVRRTAEERQRLMEAFESLPCNAGIFEAEALVEENNRRAAGRRSRFG